MKKIIVPTDYSENALNAIKYAFNIASVAGAEIIIVHVYLALIPTEYSQTDYAALVKLRDSQESDTFKTYENNVLKLIHKEHKQVKYSTRLSFGFEADDITEIATKENADMIIMGTQGAGGIKKVLLGTVSYNVIKKAKCPVMAIPAQVTFSNPKNILLATEFNEITDSTHYNTLKQIAILFNAEVKIVHTTSEEELTPTIAQKKGQISIEKIFNDVPHTYHVIKGFETVKTLEDFAISSHADIIAVLPKEQNFFTRIFGQNITKNLAHHARLPILALK